MGQAQPLQYTRLAHPGQHEEHIVSRKRWHATIGQQVGGRRPRKISWLLPCAPVANLSFWVIATAILLQVLSCYYSAPLSVTFMGWCLFLEILWKLSIVQQESVLVVHSLGLQVETVWLSGRIKRAFLPMDRIQAVIINEAVHSHTCFFYLALIVKDGTKLTVVFEHLRPPLKVLVEVYNAVHQALHAHRQHSRLEPFKPG